MTRNLPREVIGLVWFVMVATFTPCFPFENHPVAFALLMVSMVTAIWVSGFIDRDRWT